MSATPMRARVAPLVAPVGSGVAVAGSAFAGAPWYVTMLAAGAGAVSALVPQESQHRRDVWRDWLKHRERRHLIRTGRTDLLAPPVKPQRAELD